MPSISQRYFGLFLFFALFLHCTGSDETPDSHSKDVTKDIAFAHIEQDLEMLKVPLLKNGYDSLQIRIWLGHSMAVNKDLIILKFTDSKWQATHVRYGENQKKGIYRRVVPKSGWNTLVDSLTRLRIIKLPDEREISGYNGCGGTDGMPYVIEVATRYQYRIYHYCNPELNIDFWQARNILDIGEILEREFRFKYTK